MKHTNSEWVKIQPSYIITTDLMKCSMLSATTNNFNLMVNLQSSYLSLIISNWPNAVRLIRWNINNFSSIWIICWSSILKRSWVCLDLWMSLEILSIFWKLGLKMHCICFTWCFANLVRRVFLKTQNTCKRWQDSRNKVN